MSAWDAVATEGAKLKRRQLEREIGEIGDARVRSNLLHTFSKLFMFLEDDLKAALREARQAPLLNGGGR